MTRLRRAVASAALTAIWLAASATRAEAGAIVFQATDLADVVAGEDLWRYEYALTGFSFVADQGFSIYFDAATYASLEDPPTAVSPDWDIIAFQPDPGLPSDGIYDALALVTNPSLSQLFSVSFVWLGSAGTLPGNQPFTINQFDQAGNISFIDSGQTSAPTTVPVPEPSTLLLLACGLFMCRRRRAWPARADTR